MQFGPKKITTNATTQITAKSGILNQIVVTVQDAGTTWKMRIEDGVPNRILGVFTIAASSDGTPLIINFTNDVSKGIRFIDGINVITITGTPGEITVWAEADVNKN